MGGVFDWIRKTFGSSNIDTSQTDNSERLSRSIAERQIAEIMAKENAYADRDSRWGVETLEVINFEVLASDDERQDFDGGIVPWINIEDRSFEISRLVSGDETVLFYPRASIVFDYPLNNPVTREISTDRAGFSRRELVEHIGNYYEEIYEEEEASASVKTLPMDQRKIMNRNQTDGIYGIWGHDLGDIAVSGVEVRRAQNGEIFLILGVES